MIDFHVRRWAGIILLAGVLVLPFILRGAIQERKVAAAGPSQRLVIITANTQEIRRAFAAAFSDWYRKKFGQDVILDYRVPGGANDILRQLDTTYRAARSADGSLPANFHADIDMVWGGGDYFFDVKLKHTANVLEPMDIDPALLEAAFPQPTLAGVKLYDFTPSPGIPGEGGGGGTLEQLSAPTLTLPRSTRGGKKIVAPMWVGLCLSSMGIIYNPDLYYAIGLPAPKQWQDLTNEKLFGLLALADPSHSGSVALAYMMVVQRAMADAEEQFFAAHPQAKLLDKQKLAALPEYRAALANGWQRGMETLQHIAANARYFTAWGSEVPNDVGSGDAAAGTAIDFYARVYEEQVGSNRCQFIAPVGATSTTPDPIGILAGVKGEQYQLANRFIEFLLSPTGQRLWIVRAGSPGGPAERSLRRLPIRQDVYADQENWTDHVNPFETAKGFNQRNDWMGLLTDMTTVWTAAWIDDRDDLRNAQQAVLAVKDHTQREKLLSDLAELPVHMSDVSAMAAERTKLQHEPGSDLSGFVAKEDIALAEKFRKHYRQVRQLAQESAALRTAAK